MHPSLPIILSVSDNLKTLQVFIASPNDLIEERRAIKEVADELNVAFGKEVGIQVQLLSWEDSVPAYARFPQHDALTGGTTEFNQWEVL